MAYVRDTDPEPSHEAAAALDSKSICATVLRHLYRHDRPEGWADFEIVEALDGQLGVCGWHRVSDLRNDGLATWLEGQRRLNFATGRRVGVTRITKAGCEELGRPVLPDLPEPPPPPLYDEVGDALFVDRTRAVMRQFAEPSTEPAEPSTEPAEPSQEPAGGEPEPAGARPTLSVDEVAARYHRAYASGVAVAPWEMLPSKTQRATIAAFEELIGEGIITIA